MNKQSKIRWFAIATAAALVGVVTGCQHDSQVKLHGEKILPDSEPRAVQNVNAAQASSGALADSTLHAVHFNATGLNSLGRQKLDQMLLGQETPQPVVVYLDLAKPETMPWSHDVVTDYLKGRGLSDSQIKVVDGPNPETLHNSSNAITALQTLESNGQAAPGGGGTAPNTYAPPPAAPTGDSSSH